MDIEAIYVVIWKTKFLLDSFQYSTFIFFGIKLSCYDIVLNTMPLLYRLGKRGSCETLGVFLSSGESVSLKGFDEGTRSDVHDVPDRIPLR